jgi:hypothetical protein
MVVESGTPGKTGYLHVEGRPAPDGNLVLDGTVIAAALRFRGKLTPAHFKGPFRDGKYELVGNHGIRRCTVTIRTDNP